MRRFVVLALAVSVGFSFLAATLWADRRAPLPKDDIELFEEALDLVHKNLHSKEMTRRQLVEAAIDGMLLRVDPEAAYLDHDDLEFYNQTMRLKRGYVGMTVRFERHLVVVGTRPGSSAARAGILPGDHILEIDGVPVSELTVEKANQALVGKPKTRVNLKVSPPDRESGTVEVTRDG
jgi:carboxyl-terminal processing protease